MSEKKVQSSPSKGVSSENYMLEGSTAQAAWLSALIDSADDAIITKTLQGVITSWNPAAQRIFGYTPEEAIGQSVLMLIPPDHHNEEPEIVGRIGRGEKIDHYETVRVAKDGRLLDISLTVSPIVTPDGQIIGASKIARDITGAILKGGFIRRLRGTEIGTGSRLPAVA